MPRPPATPRRARDRGSVAPLVVGMVACLLLLAAGLTAATSAFLAQQRLRGACDGAAVAGANAMSGTRGPGADGSVQDIVGRYLSVRSPAVSATTDVTGRTVILTCRATAAVTFGGLFGAGHLDQHVVSVATARL